MAEPSLEQRLKELAGTTLPKGNYTLLELIASSHMSVVYKAQDNASNRTVAIKILGDDKYLWRFKAEAELGYLLNMANVASTIRADLTGETLPNGLTIKYLVMKWISGLSLSDVIRNNRAKAVPTPELLQFTVNLLKKITPALERIHAANIVHRDIKPNNIRFNNDALDKEEPYLLDFGIAKWVQPEQENQNTVPAEEKTKVWEAPGTHKYMPPEQWDGEAIPRSDEYALALLVYEVLSDGYSPFEKSISATPSTSGTGTEGRRRFDWEHAHRELQPVPIQEYRPDIPQSVWQVLLRAMNKNPVMRYENVTKFTEAFIKAVQEPAAPVSPPPAVERTIRQDIRDLPQPVPPAKPAAKAEAPAAPLNQPGTTLKMDVPPKQAPPAPIKTRPTEDILKDAAGGGAAIPPFQRTQASNKGGRSMLPFIIGGVVVVVIIAALIVLPSLNKPAEPTPTPTDLFAALAASQTAEWEQAAAGTGSAVEILLHQTLTREAEITQEAMQTASAATPTDVPPTETPIPPTVVEVVISDTDTPTSAPPSATATVTKTVTPSSTPTVAATKTPIPTASKSATPTLRPSATPTRTPTSTSTRTFTPTKTATPSATPTATATATATHTPTATITPTATSTPTPTVPPLDALDLLTDMRNAGRRANQFDCVNYIKAYDGLALLVTSEPDDAKVAVVKPLLAHSTDPVTRLYTFCKLPANVEQSRVLLPSNLANNQYRLWGGLISQAITDVGSL